VRLLAGAYRVISKHLGDICFSGEAVVSVEGAGSTFHVGAADRRAPVRTRLHDCGGVHLAASCRLLGTGLSWTLQAVEGVHRFPLPRGATAGSRSRLLRFRPSSDSALCEGCSAS
jgi:hypothetical protein